VRCEQRRPTQSPRTLNLPHLFRTALCWQRFFSGPQTHPAGFSNVWQTEVYRNWRIGSWRKNIKNVTCYNQMIVAIVDVLTSFNFFSSFYTICYILFYVPSPPLLALVFYVYCNNCHNLCFFYFICFYIVHSRCVLIYSTILPMIRRYFLPCNIIYYTISVSSTLALWRLVVRCLRSEMFT
jgi:hypothetical protein